MTLAALTKLIAVWNKINNPNDRFELLIRDASLVRVASATPNQTNVVLIWLLQIKDDSKQLRRPVPGRR